MNQHRYEDIDVQSSLHAIIEEKTPSVVQIYSNDATYLGLGIFVSDDEVLTSKHFLNS
jgi:hypothetical protein